MRRLTRAVGLWWWVGVASSALAQAPALPPEVEAALSRAQVPREAVSVVVQEVGAASPRLSWQAQQQVNPASLMKLLTTHAALDLLGPAWTWSTPVWLEGNLVNPGPQGVLEGTLFIKGQGDPKLVMERLWLLLRRVQQLGVREIRGDIVLDRSAFSVSEQSPADFDGEPLRPYNVAVDALMLNYKAITLTFTPVPARGVAMVASDPPMAGVSFDASVPLSSQPCGDWRGALKADLADPSAVRLLGAYPSACGERQWPMAYADPRTYNQRAVAGLWVAMGGRLNGSVREGLAPATPATFEMTSPSLGEVVREVNKYSNNVMAQQLFMTLALTQRGQGSADLARDVLRNWALDRIGPAAQGMVVDNGSGLSRQNRVSAQLLAQLLLRAHESPVMSELMSSLPISGLDGTMRRSKSITGRAHLKTGSLKDVAGIAGYVLTPQGQRLALVAVINHPRANAARPALDALVQWAAHLVPPAASVPPLPSPSSITLPVR